ncbi:MAG: glycosyltransferase [Chthoniobacteraceae bacterium]
MCNRNQRDALQSALEKFDAVALQKVQAELILVDRDSVDGSPSVIEKFCEEATFPVKPLFEPRRGISHARNLALEVADGEIIACFDEVTPLSEAFLQKALAAFADAQIAYATGAADAAAARPLYARDFLPAEPFENGPLLFRREVAERLHGFDIHHASDPEFRGDDLDFALRASQAGLNGIVLPTPEIPVSKKQVAARRLSAGAVYLHHTARHPAEILPAWLGSVSGRSAKPLLTECKGALRSVWESEAMQQRVRRPLFHLRNPRDFHVFGLGTSKSGTHSLHALCEKKYWTGHEPEDREFIEQIIGYETGEVSREEMKRFLVDRDRRMYLEMDASNLNIHVTDLLVELFPTAKFILTVRDCLGWVDSEINHKLSRPFPKAWQAMWDHRYQAGKIPFSPAEQLLAENHLHTLDGYLKFWNWHNQTALDQIPEHRLLVLKTKEISHATEKIAKFIGVPHQSLDVERSHAFGAARKYGVLAKLDQQMVYEKARQHCGPLMSRLFPEISLQPKTEPVA